MMFVSAILLLGALPTFAQNINVKGTVTSSTDGAPLIGVNVIEAGTTNGVVTDFDGNYSLNVKEGAVLEFSFMGFLTQRVAADRKAINVVMVEDAKALEEVVVVGYGVQKKKLVTGATIQVDGDDLQKLSTTSALTALQSQTPGVNITQSSGQPGEGFKVNIRGLGTIGNAAPLYVIDGVAGGDINIISPSDIESIDVLKDAASSAIYGARAANGVILITTKKGKVGNKVSVTYDGYYGVQNVYRMPEMLTAKQYIKVMEQLGFNQSNDVVYKWTDYMSQEQYDKFMSGEDAGTNWLEEIRNENAPTQNHSVNITGGNDMSSYSFGVSYTAQDGIFGKPVESEYRRTTVRMNSDHVLWRVNDRDIVKFGETMYYNYNTKAGIAIGNQYWNSISDCLRANPLVPVYNKDGGYFLYDDFLAQGDVEKGLLAYNQYLSNPVASMVYRHGQNKSKNHALNMSAYLTVSPIKDLVYKAQFSYKMSASTYRQYTPAYKINEQADGNNVDDDITQNSSVGYNWAVENTLNYKFALNDNHFDVLVGQAFEKSGLGEKMEGKSSNSLFAGWNYAWLTNAQSTNPTVSGSPLDEGALASFFGRINYDLKETYMASVIFRADGSSNFARGNRWGYFPSVSAGWVMSNESFMEGTKDVLDFLKIRASWGQNGNCNVDNFNYLSKISFDETAAYPYGNFGTQTGGYISILKNEDITWETSEQLDLGFDARLLDSRLGVTFDWYKKTTKDWLVEAPIPATTGVGAPFINGGDVENTGFEIALNWNDQIGDDFSYGVNVNLAHNKNEITKIANASGVIDGPTDVLSQGTTLCYRCKVGEPIGYFYGYKTAGVMQNNADVQKYLADNCGGDATKSLQGEGIQPGDLKFVDVNGDGIITTDDKTKIGNPHPDYTMGFSFNCAYKGFDLAVTATGAFGQQILRSYRKFVDGRNENYATFDVYNCWYGEGTSNKYPRLTPGGVGVNWQNISDIYCEDADYVKIQNVTLGYDFKKLWTKCPLQQVRLYVTAQNLFTITGYKGMDPEVGASGNEDDYSWGQGIDLGYYPSPRTYLVGLNVKF